MNRKTTYKGYQLEYRTQGRGVNAFVFKNGQNVFDTWKRDEDQARTELMNWVDNQPAPTGRRNEPMNTTIYINDEPIETDFFQGFNWYNFESFEAIFLDDCEETDFLIARFWRIEDGEDGRKIILKAIDRGANRKSSYQKSTTPECSKCGSGRTERLDDGFVKCWQCGTEFDPSSQFDGINY